MLIKIECNWCNNFMCCSTSHANDSNRWWKSAEPIRSHRMTRVFHIERWMNIPSKQLPTTITATTTSSSSSTISEQMRHRMHRAVCFRMISGQVQSRGKTMNSNKLLLVRAFRFSFSANSNWFWWRFNRNAKLAMCQRPMSCVCACVVDAGTLLLLLLFVYATAPTRLASPEMQKKERNCSWVVGVGRKLAWIDWFGWRIYAKTLRCRCHYTTIIGMCLKRMQMV